MAAGNEYTPSISSGTPSPSSSFAGTLDRAASIAGSTDQSQGATIATAVGERSRPSTTAEPPNKKIKLEHEDGSTPSTSKIAPFPPAPAASIPSPSKAAESTRKTDNGVEVDSSTPVATTYATADADAGGSNISSIQVKEDPSVPQATPNEPPSRHQDSHEGFTVVTSATDASHQTAQSSSAHSSRDSLAIGAAASYKHAAAPGPSQAPPTAAAPVIPPPAAAITPSAAAPAAASVPSPVDAPLKSLTFAHLNTKYLAELEYMLREFRKLERQLLGAKGAAQLEESAGSRERREKLHSFILHLEDTVRQIELGCKMEVEGKTAAASGSGECEEGDASKKLLAQESALSNLTKEREEEENVQKLEEHILANLLPVKVRLKKQLAAQQGATQNPAGMPSRRGSLQPPSAAHGKGTFAEAAEKRRKLAEEARLAAQEQHERTARRVSDPTQFGKPLGGGGSSLTRNLHGATLGSTQRIHGHGVGVASKPDKGNDGNGIGERKILYAGMVPGSTQQKSGLSAASGAHDMITTSQRDSGDVSRSEVHPKTEASNAIPSTQTSVAPSTRKATVPVEPKPVQKPPAVLAPSVAAAPHLSSSKSPVSVQKKAPQLSQLSEDEQRKLRKLRRKKKLQRIAKRQERERQKQQNAVQQQTSEDQPPASSVSAVRKKTAHAKGQKKKGPRAVEYICALCSEAYNSTCDYNPWWALAQHECPKCRKTQVRLVVARL
jgi:hypothetical protein